MQQIFAAVQKKRSFLLIYVIILILFTLYLLPALQLYRRAGESELWVNRTNDILRQIKSAQTDVRDIEVSLQGYLLTGSDHYKQALVNKAEKTIEKVSHLADITREYPGQYDKAIAVRDLIVQKKSTVLLLIDEIARGKRTPSDPDIRKLMDSGNDVIDRNLSEMESDQSALLAAQTSEHKQYTLTKLRFLVAGFLLVTAFLGAVCYKLWKKISKRSLAEESAHKQEAKYRALVENAGVTTLIIDSHGIIRFVSRNIEELAGYSIGDLLGKPFYSRVAKEFRNDLLHVTSNSSSIQNYNTSAEIRIITASQDQKWVSCRIFPASKDGDKIEWQVVLWDIEDEKQRQLEFEALEADHRNRLKMVQDIIDNVPSVLYIKDKSGTYLMVNKKTEEVFHLPAGEIIGKTTEDLYRDSPERLKIYKETDDEVIRHQRIVELEEIVKEEEKDHYFLILKFPLLDEKGLVKYIGVIASDITDMKETEFSLIESRQEAEQARTAQEVFLANMSHEIRTPMNGIIGMANLLMSTALNEEQKDFTESIQESAGSLLSIINDLLDFSKIKAGKFEFERIAFKPRHSIRKAIYPLQFRAEEKMIKLNLAIDGSVPEVLNGDPLRLQQVIINLTANALKFTSNGSVDIYVSSEKTGDKKVALSISVKDTGIGIPSDKLHRIFESFAQSKAEDARKYGGTGLGLAIVKQLVELQHGTITVKSTVGKGSVFSLVIPYETGEELTGERSFNDFDAPSQQLLANVRILVAEDNLINQKVARNTLSRQGAYVTVVNNGQEVIQQIKQGGYDIILMDLQMPEVDGYKATRYIRQVMQSDIPIIAMTADALKGEEEKCFEAGMNDYISKPFEPAHLYQVIRRNTGAQSGPAGTYILKPAEDHIVDFSFLEQISENDSSYIHEVLDIFLNTMPEGLAKLEALVSAEDFGNISRQAHFLKSSVGVVKVRNMYDHLATIEALAREKKDLHTIRSLIKEIMSLFKQAQPAVLTEKEKHKPA